MTRFVPWITVLLFGVIDGFAVAHWPHLYRDFELLYFAVYGMGLEVALTALTRAPYIWRHDQQLGGHSSVWYGATYAQAPILLHAGWDFIVSLGWFALIPLTLVLFGMEHLVNWNLYEVTGTHRSYESYSQARLWGYPMGVGARKTVRIDFIPVWPGAAILLVDFFCKLHGLPFPW